MIDLTQLTQARQLSALNWGVTRPDELSELEAAVDAVLQADQIGWCTNHLRQSENGLYCYPTVMDPCVVVSVVVVPVETQKP